MRRQRVRYFTFEEKQKLLNYLSGRSGSRRASTLYKLMFATGLRVHEVSGLRVGDVEDKSVLEIIGKGNKHREIPLSSAIQEEIAAFLDWKLERGQEVSKQAPLFVSRKHRQLSCRGIQYDLDKWTRLAGIEGKYSPHALRHTVGFELMRKTNNIRKVQEFLGHNQVTTTQIYTHVTKEDLQECAELLTI